VVTWIASCPMTSVPLSESETDALEYARRALKYSALTAATTPSCVTITRCECTVAPPKPIEESEVESAKKAGVILVDMPESKADDPMDIMQAYDGASILGSGPPFSVIATPPYPLPPLPVDAGAVVIAQTGPRTTIVAQRQTPQYARLQDGFAYAKDEVDSWTEQTSKMLRTCVLSCPEPLHAYADCIAKAEWTLVRESYSHYLFDRSRGPIPAEPCLFGTGGADRTWLGIARDAMRSRMVLVLAGELRARGALSAERVRELVPLYKPDVKCQAANCTQYANILRGVQLCSGVEYEIPTARCQCSSSPLCETCYVNACAMQWARSVIEGAPYPCLMRCTHCERVYCMRSALLVSAPSVADVPPPAAAPARKRPSKKKQPPVDGAKPPPRKRAPKSAKKGDDSEATTKSAPRKPRCPSGREDGADGPQTM